MERNSKISYLNEIFKRNLHKEYFDILADDNVDPPEPPQKYEKYKQKSFEIFDQMVDYIENNSKNKDYENEYGEILPPVDHINHLSPVRDQGGCGSCWAFATTLVIESNYNIANKKSKSHYRRPPSNISPLSTQELVSCADHYWTRGCSGGWMPYAMKWISQNNNGKLLSENQLPYTGRADECPNEIPIAHNNVKVIDNGFESCDDGYFTKGNPCTKKKWYDMLTKGPVATCIDAWSKGFLFYDYGIIDLTEYDSQCYSQNHAVVAFAWLHETQEDGSKKEFIRAQNSWGKDWGEQGLFNIYYNPDYGNTCWLTRIAVLPTLAPLS